MGLFGTRHVNKGSVEQVAGMIGKFFRSRGLDSDGHVVETCDGYGWWLTQGSAKIYVFVQDDKGGPVLRINSPILHFPDVERERFFLHLLELNRDLTDCWLCVCDEVVIVTAQRPTLGLDQEELDSLIWSVAQVADLLDDRLAREFNARVFSQAEAPAT
jgi:hypothetical protein